MNLKLRNPLVIFDLETTGTNIVKDRIVEISLLKVEISGETEIKTLRINPEIPIPHETSLIHGIYDEDVKDCPTFRQEAKNIAEFMRGADLGGFNLLKFDIPVLVEEFLRADLQFDISKRKIVDVQKIFHLMEKRTLKAAYKFYCDKELTDAHNAEADTKATWEILQKQVEQYENETVTDLRGKELGVITPDMDDLHKVTRYDSVDIANRMVRDSKGRIVFNFGKYKGQEVAAILKKDQGYYNWIMQGDFALDTKRKLTQIKLDTKL